MLEEIPMILGSAILLETETTQIMSLPNRAVEEDNYGMLMYEFKAVGRLPMLR